MQMFHIVLAGRLEIDEHRYSPAGPIEIIQVDVEPDSACNCREVNECVARAANGLKHNQCVANALLVQDLGGRWSACDRHFSCTFSACLGQAAALRIDGRYGGAHGKRKPKRL